MKVLLHVVAVASSIISLPIGALGLYMAGQELSSLYFRTAAYHIVSGQYQQAAALLGVIGFLARHLFTSLFVVGVVLMALSFFLWRFARRLRLKAQSSAS